VGSNTVRLYFRRELALAQSLFDRFLAAINPLPLGLVVASVGDLFVFARHSARFDSLKGPTLCLPDNLTRTRRRPDAPSGLRHASGCLTIELEAGGGGRPMFWVMAGLDPAIPLGGGCLPKRDHRGNPGDDSQDIEASLRNHATNAISAANAARAA
jgi:hypothetical protein